ncbi:MAG: DUF5050 domain-containing protein [Oscillospiraceae bacterium]|nr:DUF5050 domain-containing protein [Oscillospiraceae bacterium]
MKRVISMFIALVLLLSLCACGGPAGVNEGKNAVIHLGQSTLITYNGGLYLEENNFTWHRKLANAEADWLCWYLGMAVYVDRGSGMLMRARLDSDARQVISEDLAAQPYSENQWVYYINRSDGNRLYRFQPEAEGETREALSRRACVSYAVAGGQLYYSSGRALYALSLEEGEERKLADGRDIRRVRLSQLQGDATVILFSDAGKLMELVVSGDTAAFSLLYAGVGSDWAVSGQTVYYAAGGALLRVGLGPEVPRGAAAPEEARYAQDPDDPHRLLWRDRQGVAQYSVGVPGDSKAGGDWYVTVNQETAACVLREDESVFAEFPLAELDADASKRRGVTVLAEGCDEVVGISGEWIFFVSSDESGEERLERVFVTGRERTVVV